MPINPLPPSDTHITTMKLICPFTDLQEETEQALAEYPTQYVDVSGSVEDYFWLYYRLWKEGEPFMVVEHDHRPWPGALKELWDCPEEFCAFEVPMSTYANGQIMYAIGPLKYSANIIERFPNLWENSKPNDRYWTNAAEWGYTRLGRPHIHTPPCDHFNPERMSMDWNSYVTYRKVHGPVQPRTGRKPSATKEMPQGT